MAEFYYDQSPYNYVANDPINFIDPDGNFRTRIGAWCYKLWNGGDGIGQDTGGEYFVYTDNNSTDDDGVTAVVTSTRVFDKNGRSEGKDLKFEREAKAVLAQWEFERTLTDMGIEYSYTNDRTEAIRSMLQIPSMVVLPNVLKATSLITTKSGINTVDDLLKAAGNLKRVKGAKQGFVNGNVDEIFNSIVKGGTNVRGNLYRLNDGTLVNLHKSTKTGVQTIDINKAGQVFKIRIQ